LLNSEATQQTLQDAGRTPYRSEVIDGESPSNLTQQRWRSSQKQSDEFGEKVYVAAHTVQ